MLKLWREDGLTVVFVTHSVYESAFLSTRLIVMTPRPGRVAGEIRVTAPQVRTQEWRATPEFAASRAKFPSPSATRWMWARTSARAYNRPIIQPASQPTFASIGLRPPRPRSAKKQSARNYEGRLRDVRRGYPARATNLLGYSFGDDRLAALRLQVRVGKPQNLKTAGITDDPEIQLAPFPVSGRNFDKARQTGLLFDGSVDAR